MMNHILIVVGARPQFVKLAPLVKALQERGQRPFVVHTGQHWDAAMSEVFFSELGIPAPDKNLGVGSGKHGWQTGQMLAGLEEVMADLNPDWVVVVGDTNSTAAGALACAKLDISLAHVEAGVRSYNRSMPEEINRIVTDHISDLLLAPSLTAVDNLRKEGIAGDHVCKVGDVMQDSFARFSQLAESGVAETIQALGIQSGAYVLATVHRAENTDHPGRLLAILEGLNQVAKRVQVVLPQHPRVRDILGRMGVSKQWNSGFHMINPVSYLQMLGLERHAAVIATDSGGVQKEAFFARVPCVTLRNETEWPELIDLGWNRLCFATAAEEVAREVLSAIGATGEDGDPYGEGAAHRIAEILLDSNHLESAQRHHTYAHVG